MRALGAKVTNFLDSAAPQNIVGIHRYFAYSLRLVCFIRIYLAREENSSELKIFINLSQKTPTILFFYFLKGYAAPADITQIA